MTNTVSQVVEKMQGFIAKAAGEVFTSETEKKEAMRQLSNGFKSGHEAMLQTIWAAQREAGRESEEFERLNLLFWDLPADLHNWRAKHAAPMLALDPELSKVIEVIEALQSRREAIKAAEIKRKTLKRDEPIQAGDRTQERGHCQLCGLEHAVSSGHMAHHGYRVRFGFFNGNCHGYQYGPMEHDRTQTDKVVAALRANAVDQSNLAARYQSGEVKPRTAREAARYGAKEVPFAMAPVEMQAQAVEVVVRSLTREARDLERIAQELQKLADTYHGQPLRTVKV